MSDNLFKDPNESVENKKKDNENGGKNLNFKKFTITFFGHFLVTICLFTVVIGACGLYTAKVAQSNILPINPEFAPYTDKDYEMKDPPASVFMNIVKERAAKGLNFWDEPLSTTAQQATFIKEDFNDNKIFKYLCKIKPFSEENENFSRMTFFLRKLFINGILSSFDMVNTIYSFLYSFPEWFLMLIYFTILPFIFTFLIFWNAFKIFMEAISNIIIPFRINNPKDGKDRDVGDIKFTHQKIDDKDPTSEWWRKWTECEIKKYNENHKGIWNTITEFMDYIGYGIMFMIYVMITINIIMPLSVIVTVFGLFNPLLRKYNLKGEENKENGIGDFLRDTFVYKKTFIIFLAAYNLLMTTSVYLGPGYTFSCFVGLLVLATYFEVFVTPNAIKINIDDTTQQILKDNRYSNTTQSKQILSNVIFNPCEKSSTSEMGDGSNNVEITGEVVSPLHKNLTANNNAVKKSIVNDTNVEKTDFFGKGREKIKLMKKSIGDVKDASLKNVKNARDAVQSLHKKGKTLASSANNTIKNIPDEIRNKLNAKSHYTKLDSENTDTNNTFSETNNPLHKTSDTSVTSKGGARRNKNGSLHKKYNFSLV
jgi:hypothetical protein